MKLNKLTLKNFKGIKDLTIDMKGKNTNIYGKNGEGKTTIYDAFLWLLFDKDSTNRKDFNIKTLDENGEAIHMLEHTVEAIIDNTIFKKTLNEKWTKKRGEAEKEFTGHETSYYIDEVPVKKNEYQDRINELVDENIFKLITNPLYFNTSLKWQERRELLLSICGDVDDEQLIAEKGLTEVLKNRTVDDLKKIITDKIKKLNEDINKIPVRIDELNLNSDTPDNVNYEEIEQGVQAYTKQLEVLENELLDTQKHVNEYTKKLNEISDLKMQLRELENELRLESKTDLITAEMDLKLKESEINKVISESKTAQTDISRLEKDIETEEEEMKKLRTEWGEENKKQLDMSNVKDTCPTCNQKLPDAEIEETKNIMLSNFEEDKKRKLADITSKGKSRKEQCENFKKMLQNIKSVLETVNSDLKFLEENKKELETKIQTLKSNTTEIDITSNPKYIELQKQIEDKQAILEAPAIDVAEIIKTKTDVQAKIQELNKILANKENAEKTQARIEELKKEEKELSLKMQELERQKFLVEEFIVAKVNMLEKTINDKFKNVSFKLFETQINGGIKECCETLVNGVPFSDVNNAGKINAGMDIINTLVEHYNIKAPIFIDNAESIIYIYKIDTQLIRLVVEDTNLKVEVVE